jgi:hypothetical protein
VYSAIRKGWLDGEGEELQAKRADLVEILMSIALDKTAPGRERVVAAKILIFVHGRDVEQARRLLRVDGARMRKRLKRLERKLQRKGSVQ